MTAEPSFATRFDQLASERGAEPALTLSGRTLTFEELDRAANRLGRHLQSLAVGIDDFVTIAEPNSIEFVTTMIASWKVGATPQPVSSRLPWAELEAIIDLADPRVVVGAEVAGRTCLPLGFDPPAELDDSPLPDAIASSWKAPTSGGSTGRPKLIVVGDPSVYTERAAVLALIIGAREGATMVMPGPLYHNGPLIWTTFSLLAGAHVVLLPRFEPEATLRAVEDHRATAIYMVPTMMQRISKLPEPERSGHDLSSLETLFHLAEPCPRWVGYTRSSSPTGSTTRR